MANSCRKEGVKPMIRILLVSTGWIKPCELAFLSNKRQQLSDGRVALMQQKAQPTRSCRFERVQPAPIFRFAFTHEL
jgi:hypothetical protein